MSVSYWLPTETWTHIFRLATTEDCHGIYETEYVPFRPTRPKECRSPVQTAINLFGVSKQWQPIAAKFLFQRVWVRQGVPGLLKSLKGSSQSEGYGRHVRHLELPVEVVNYDRSNPTRLLDILACCPYLEILVKPAVDSWDGQFWSDFTQPPTNDIALTSLTRLYWLRGYVEEMEHDILEDSRSILANLIFRSPNLRYLSVSPSYLPIFKDVDRTAHPVLLPSLVVLHLTDADYDAMSEIDIQHGDIPNLTHLVLDPDDLECLCQTDESILHVFGQQLRVVELHDDLNIKAYLDLNPFFKLCPNLQEFGYYVGFPPMQVEGALHRMDLNTINLHLGEESQQDEPEFFWSTLHEEFAKFSAHVFPVLKRVILHGDWDFVVFDTEFRPLRQLVLDQGWSLEYPDGTSVQ